ncbi:MAG: hypothetical protein JNK89_05325 [Saprospiraceae bacterium]|nr:hypothetical protein [Saprospiraceae bacterium]
MEFRSQQLLEEAKSKMRANHPGRAADFAYEAETAFYSATKDAKSYLKTVQAYQKKEIKSNAARLHDLVVRMLRAFPSDEAVLKQAEKWAKSAAETGGLSEYYLTLAEVYKRQGKRDKARAAAQKALDAAKSSANGMDGKVEYFLRDLEED